MGFKAAVLLGLLPQLISASVVCSYSVAASSGDTCESFAATWGQTVDGFTALNPGVACPTLTAGESYCLIGTVTADSTTTTTTTKTTTTTTAPTTTTTIKTTTTAPTTTTTIKTTTTAPTTTSTTAKTTTKATTTTSTTVKTTTKATTTTAGYEPTQSGIPSNCDKFHLVQSGDQCDTIAAKYGITIEQFDTWNPSINSACSNLWLDYYVCVHVPGATTGPSPQMPDIISTCKTYYKVKSGDSCYTIDLAAGITLAKFRQWNTYIDATCTNLWVDYYVCIAA